MSGRPSEQVGWGADAGGGGGTHRARQRRRARPPSAAPQRDGLRLDDVAPRHSAGPDPVVRYNLGAVYANLGRTAEACATWKSVLALPDEAGAQGQAREGRSILGCPP